MAQVSAGSRPTLRSLGPADAAAVQKLLDADPLQNVYVASRIGAVGLDPWRLSAEVWGYDVGGRLEACCYAGANLVPIGAGPAAVEAFAERALRRRRTCSSIVGPSAAVEHLWGLLEPTWGPARDVRRNQPVLATAAPPLVPPDPLVRRVRPDEIDLLLPASIAMFTEEVGVSPLADGDASLYRARVAELVDLGRAFARTEDGRVVFKAEIGAVTSTAGQVQGVWVAPERRGEGLSHGGMAAVVAATLESIAPIVTLYVNDYNAPARAAYRRVGFQEFGTCMTVLF